MSFFGFDGKEVVVTPSDGRDHGFLPGLASPDTNANILVALNRLVALKLYELHFPLASVYEADPSGLVERGVLALAAEKIAESAPIEGAFSAQLKALGVDPTKVKYDPATGLTAFDVVDRTPPVESTAGEPDDPLFYDRVRQLATYLHVPFDALTDLDELATRHQWTRETIADTLTGMGLVD